MTGHGATGSAAVGRESTATSKASAGAPAGASSVATEAALRRAYDACEAITRRRARNFWYGLRLTPEPARGAMYAIYAWMRQADDLADADADALETVGAAMPDAAVRRTRIEQLRERTIRLFRGEACSAQDRTDPVWTAMADVVRRHRLEFAPFSAMLDGQIEDIDGRAYRTFDDVRGFCERVASTVGVVCVRIWGVADPSTLDTALELAVDRGVAFQLTNILRDVREDRRRGRVYLPGDELAAHGLDADALLRWEPAPTCRAFVLEQVARAESLYRRSAPLEALITPTCRPTLWAMTSIYHGILERIASRPERIVGRRRVRLSSITKAMIALRARRMGRNASSSVSAP